MRESRMSATLIGDTQFGSITKQNKLMKLAENVKNKKKSFTNSTRARKTSLQNKKAIKLDPGYTNSIEHLVFGVYRPKSSSNQNTPEKDASEFGTRNIDGVTSPLSRTSGDYNVQNAWRDGQEHQMWPHSPHDNIFHEFGVNICPVPSIHYCDSASVTSSGATIFANMPALRNNVDHKKSVPVIKNLSLSQVSSLNKGSLRKSTGMVENDRTCTKSSIEPEKARRRSAPSSAATRGSFKSNLPVPTRNLGTFKSDRTPRNKKITTSANSRSASCDSRRNVRCDRLYSSQNKMQQCNTHNKGNQPFTRSTKNDQLDSQKSKDTFTRKYSSACSQANLRSSNGNIEKRISAFKRCRAKSETTLSQPHRRTSTGSMIPVPINSTARFGSARSANSSVKYVKSPKNSLSNNDQDVQPEVTVIIRPPSDASESLIACETSVLDDSEWQDSPKIRALQDEQAKQKSASENLDMLLMNIPDSSKSHEKSEIFSNPTNNLSQTNNILERRGSEPSPNISDHRKTILECRNFSDPDLNSSSACLSFGNSSFYCVDSELAPRFASLRTYSDSKPSETVLQKFKKSFSLRFNKNRNEQCFSDPATPIHGSSNTFLSLTDQVVTDHPSGSFHPATIAGISPVTTRKSDTSTMSSTSPDASNLANGNVSRRSSSKDKKKLSHRKEVRGSKCSSTDSGIQIELSNNNNNANSNGINVQNNNHLTPSNQNKLEAPTSPVIVKRRPKPLSNNNKRPRRPYSDLGGSINDPSLLAEAIRVGLVIDDNRKVIKRTLSDLSQNEYMKLFMRSESFTDLRPLEYGSPQKQRHVNNEKLRRSSSQPLMCSNLIINSAISPNVTPLHKRDNMNNKRNKMSSVSLSNHHLNTEMSMPIVPDNHQSSLQSYTFAEAVWDHVTMDHEELAFKAGEVVQVVDMSHDDWWWGVINGKTGWFPASFVWLRVNQEKTADESSSDVNLSLNSSLTSLASQLTTISTLSNDQIRTNVINEIVSCENDYVTHLKDVCQGYLLQVYRRPDMFSDEQISVIFGNIEQIYSFQKMFLDDLKRSIDWSEPHKSQIGSCFLYHREGFKIYSEYCNNHPQAVSLLQELYENPKYVHFFEACRLLQDMIDISLDGFLLNPVQKICKYPLQLAELLKYTNSNHLDYALVKQAHETMKNVAHLINERKRRMECLEKLISWQRNIVDWEGPDLIETCSELIHSGEVSKVTTWSREVSLFLFDHLLIYCKRDLLKRNVYVYKGRINLDTSHVTNIDDCKDSHFGASMKNAWRIHCKEKNKTYLFQAKSAEEKEKWIAAFQKERKRVVDDVRQGFRITRHHRQQAKLAADKSSRSNKRPKIKAVKNSGYMTGPTTKQSARLIINDDYSLPPECSLKSRTGSLPHGVSLTTNLEINLKKKPTQSTTSWFNFGSTKKIKR